MAAVNKQPAAGGVAPWLEAPHDVELITRPELFLFAWLVDLVARISTPGKSRDEVRNNLVQFKQRYLPARPPPDLLFAVYRLLVPKLDKERQVYHIKEAALAELVAFAVGAQKGTEPHQKLVNWRKTQKGIFLDVVKEVVQSFTGKGMKRGPSVAEVNILLDRLAKAAKRDEKGLVLRDVATCMDAMQFRFFCAIALKDLKVGATEKTIWATLHPDAEDIFNNNCDLRKTLEKVAEVYPDIRIQRQDVVPGQMVRPQVADKVNRLEILQEKTRKREYVAELKFDGERFQLHKDGNKIYYWSRNMNDWGPRGYNIFDPVVMSQVKRDKCVLDGEMVIWHRGLQQFVPFGSCRGVVNHVRRTFVAAEPVATESDDDGEEHGDGAAAASAPPATALWTLEELSEMEVWFVAFDILYDGTRSVIDRPLAERHKLLAAAVALRDEDKHLEITSKGYAGGALYGAIRLVLPAPASVYSCVVRSAADVEPMLMRAMDANEEGLIFKDLAKPWIPGDRSDSWLKTKPDYLPTEDLDLLIIGAYMGTGRRGGGVSQFLLGLAEKPAVQGALPTVFRSFCKVGTGMTDAELMEIRRILNPLLLMASTNPPPKCYVVKGGEQVHWWVSDPTKSLVLTVKADVRLVGTTVFACKYSLRFPRVTSVAWSKLWSDILTDADLNDLSDAGRLKLANKSKAPVGAAGAAAAKRRAGKGGGDSGRGAPVVKERRIAPGGVTGFVPGRGVTLADLSSVPVEGNLFEDEVVYVLSAPEPVKVAIRRNGGTLLLNMTSSATMVISDVWPVQPGSRLYARASDVMGSSVDVLTPSYIAACVDAKAVIPPQLKHFMRFSPLNPQHSIGDVVDRYGNSYTEDIDVEDMRALLRNGSAAAASVEHAVMPPAQMTAASRSAKAKIATAAAKAVATAPHIKEEVDVQAIMAEAGLLHTSFGLLRGCRILMVPVAGPDVGISGQPMCDAQAAAVAAAEVTRPLAIARLGLCIRLHGGEVATAMDDAVTHVVAMQQHVALKPVAAALHSDDDDDLPSVEDVEDALRGDPAQLECFMRRVSLHADRRRSSLDGNTGLHVITEQWLLNRLEAAQEHIDSKAPARDANHSSLVEVRFALPSSRKRHAIYQGEDGEEVPSKAQRTM